MDQSKRNALTITEAAHEYGLPVYCLRTLVKEHKLPVIQSGSRCYILRSVMEAFLQTGGEPYKVSCSGAVTTIKPHTTDQSNSMNGQKGEQ